MNIKSYFDRELSTTAVLAVLGAIVGYVSFTLNNSSLSFLVMVVVAGAAILLLSKIRKVAVDIKWWLSNGLVVYILLWLVVWTIFYNVAIR